MTTSSDFMDLPVEVFQRILIHCHPRDVAEVSKTCRLAYNLIYHTGEYLWRQLYIANFDIPEADREAALQPRTLDDNKPNGTKEHHVDYRKRLTDLVKTERAVTRPPQSPEEERETLQLLISMLQELPVYERTDGYGVRPSLNAKWLEVTLDEDLPILASSAADPIVPKSNPDEVECMKARLRLSLLSSFTQPINPDFFLSADDACIVVTKRNRSRLYVYDFRNYSSETGWGPFTIDDRINWVHIEHLMNVVWMNLSEAGFPKMPRPSLGTEAFRPHSSGGSFSTVDWAGVEGVWSRYVCFMDYRDLFALNLAEPHNDEPLDQDFFDETFREATRLLEVKLELVDRSILTGCESEFKMVHQCSSHRPPLYFKGTSRGADSDGSSVIKGCVYEERDGSIRWRFESIYDHSPQWSSSGAQIGDVGSAVGVIGVWTTVAHDEGDPIGPFWMFKNDGETPIQVMDFN